MNTDESVLLVLIEHKGEHIWDRNATIKIKRSNGGIVHRRNPPPEASFKRLSRDGHVRVETHNVSVWAYVPTGYSHVVMDEPAWHNRVEIRVALTDSGWQHCANLGLLD